MNQAEHWNILYLCIGYLIMTLTNLFVFIYSRFCREEVDRTVTLIINVISQSTLTCILVYNLILQTDRLFLVK